MASPNNPHDKFFRSAMQNHPVAQSFFKRYLPTSILKTLKTSSLKLENTSYITDELQETLSDLVFSCQYTECHSNAKIILLVEHQSKPQKLMPFRVYHYLFNLLYRELKERPADLVEDKLPCVFALVFYHGKQTPYPYSMNLQDCFDDPYGLMRNVLLNDIPLIDVNKEQDDELKQLQLLGVMAMALKHSRDKDIQKYFIELADNLNSIDLSHHLALNFIRTVLNYLLGVGAADDLSQLMKESWRLPEPVRGEFMTIAEQLKALGKQEGREQGREETQERFAINLLKEGAEPKFVAKVAELELSFVVKLQKQLAENSNS